MAKQKKIFFETFKTLDDLLMTLGERPENEVFRRRAENKDLSSQRKEKGRGFSETKDYAEAMEIMKTGYKEPLEKMKRGILKIGESENYKKPRTRADFVGFVPHVPHTLMNLPITMINREPIQQRRSKTIHLTYSFCASGSVSPSTLIKGGINFISLVNSLEKQGYRVKIDIFFLTVSDKSAVGFSLNVKQYGQRLNLLKLTFPLVHPAMLRRIAFRYLETAPELKDMEYQMGYGMPLPIAVGSGEGEREFLKEHSMLAGENKYYCNVIEASEADGIEGLAEVMNIK
jgi:hypothetical protein